MLTRTIQSIVAYFRRHRKTFLYGMICSVVVHLYFFVNTTPNYDALVTQRTYNLGLSLGRYTHSISTIASSPFQLPWVTGVLCFIWLSIACVFVLDLLDVKSNVGLFIGSALLISFPTLAASFAFTQSADGIAMGIMLAAASVKLIRDTRFGILTGAVLLAISIGIYQAHVCFAMLLLVIVFAFQILDDAFSSPKELILQAMQYAAAVVLAYILYLIGFKFCLLVTGYTLPNTYQDVGAVFSLSLHLADSFRMTFSEIGTMLRSGLPFVRFIRVPMLALTALASLLCSVRLFIYNRVYKKPLSVVALLLILPLIAVSLTAPSYVSTNVGYHAVMRTSWLLLFVAVAALSERVFSACALSVPAEDTTHRYNRFCRIFTLTICIVMAWNFWICSNMGYLALHQSYEKDYATMVRVADRLEQRDDFSFETPLLCTGVRTYPDSGLFTYETGFRALGMSDYSILIYDHLYNLFLSYYTGVTMSYPGDDVRDRIIQTEAYKAMPLWPDKDSVANIDGVLVVKMGNRP